LTLAIALRRTLVGVFHDGSETRVILAHQEIDGGLRPLRHENLALDAMRRLRDEIAEKARLSRN
jgi:hypothetical protein